MFKCIKIKLTKPLVDVNECSDSPSSNNCSENADCVNTPGSFECNCRSGYIGDGVNCTGRLKTLRYFFSKSCLGLT